MKLAAFPLFFLFGSALSGAEIVRGPYLQQSTPDQITIVWRSQSEMKSPEVKILIEGVVVSDPTISILKREAAKGDVPLSATERGIVQYEATVSNLTPNTHYHYRIYDGEKEFTDLLSLPNLSFQTHPRPGQPDTKARIWVVGDSGTGSHAQLLVHEAMKRQVERDKRPLDLYLHVGDMAYGEGTDQQFQKNFFEPYADTLCHTVCWASMGNHEGKSSEGKSGKGPYYDAYVCPKNGEAGGVPSGSEAYYAVDYGDIHFICLNSHDLDRRPEGQMAQWLKKDLEANQSQWLIAFWHHPPYTKGTHDSDKESQLVEMRKYIMPILEKGGVDLVLSGHSHIYERSMLIDGAYATPTVNKDVVFDDGDGKAKPYRKPAGILPHKGTVAIVTGHGGALGRSAKGVMPVMRSIVLEHGSLILDIDGDTLTGMMIDSMAKVRDQFSIVKGGDTDPKRIANPWTPDKSTIEYPDEKKERKDSSLPLPKKHTEIIPPHSEWEYLADRSSPSDLKWTTTDFESNWKTGPAGFGYGDDDDRTELKDMKGKFSTIFIRREFTIPEGIDPGRLGLAINYDDAFILYVNGQRIHSQNFELDLKSKKFRPGSHEAEGYEYFPLKDHSDVFVAGQKNVIAIEGHNVSLKSSDLTIDPYLILEGE